VTSGTRVGAGPGKSIWLIVMRILLTLKIANKALYVYTLFLKALR
jgi:hypothetical protein